MSGQTEGMTETAAVESTPESHVRAALAAWLTAYNHKDRDAFYALYDPAIVYTSEHAPIRRGLDQVKDAFAPAFADQTSRLSFREEALFASTDLALISGTYHFSTLEADGSLQPGNSGRVALVYRKGADGRWLLVFDTDNSPPDAADFR